MNNEDCFDRVAHQWDEMRESFFSEAVRDRAFAIADVQKGQIAADIGAGTGFISEGLIRRGLQMIAVDQSEVMLAEMKKKFAEVDEVDCRVGEAGKLPIADEAVNYVFANMFLHHVEVPLKTIKKLVRTLRPGEKLVITDMDEHAFEFLRVGHHDRWMGFKPQDIGRWFEEAGLKNVVVDCAGENCCAKSSCGDEEASISMFVALGEK